MLTQVRVLPPALEMQPKIKDPWKALRELRKELEAEGKLISKERIRGMIKESKKEEELEEEKFSRLSHP